MAVRFFSRRDVLKIGVATTGALLVPGRVSALTGVKASQVTSMLYCAHLVADAGGYFQKEGVDVEMVTSPSIGSSTQMLAAGRVHYVLGDSSYPQRLTEQGRPTSILFVTDQRCPHANILIRRDLYQDGVTSFDTLGVRAPKDGKWKAGANAVGTGTWIYGSFIFRSRPARAGKTLNDSVEWISVGRAKAQLGALKTAKIDLLMSSPEIILEADAGGYGTLLFDVREDKQWLPVFKGPISATASYALKTTTQRLKAETLAYVTACYRACQWMKDAAPAEIAKVIERYEDTLGLSKESLVKSLEWYKPTWTYDLVYTRENYDAGLNVAKRIKPEKSFPYAEIVDLTFLRAASSRS